MYFSRNLVADLAGNLKPQNGIDVWLGTSGPFTVPVKTIIVASAHDFVNGDHSNEDEEACRLTLHYIDKGSIPEWEVDDDEDQADMVPLYTQTWILGHVYKMPKLQNAVMDRLLHLTTSHPTKLEPMRMAFEQTLAGCPLQQLMAEALVMSIRKWDCGLEYNDLADFENYPGAMDQILDALREFNRDWDQDWDVWKDRRSEAKRGAYMVPE